MNLSVFVLETAWFQRFDSMMGSLVYSTMGLMLSVQCLTVAEHSVSKSIRVDALFLLKKNFKMP